MYMPLFSLEAALRAKPLLQKPTLEPGEYSNY